MQTSDKVLVLLAAELVCCGLLVLASLDLLGSLSAWLLGGSLPWILAVLVIVGIVLVVFRRTSPNRSEADGRSMERDEPWKP